MGVTDHEADTNRFPKNSEPINEISFAPGQTFTSAEETLGGAGSIRGFREYRFRDSRNILLNVEYRWEVWTYADLAVFYDGGKVFSDASDLNFSDLESGYGFGIRGHGPGGSVMRFDFAWSREGFIWHIGSGPSF